MIVKKTLITIGLGLLLLVPVAGYAQGVCVFVTLKVESLNGRVQTKTGEIPGAVVELRDWNSHDTIKKVVSDEFGYFELDYLKKGKYVIHVTHEVFSTLDFPVRLNPKSTKGGKMLLIFLAPAFKEPCADGGGAEWGGEPKPKK